MAEVPPRLQETIAPGAFLLATRPVRFGIFNIVRCTGVGEIEAHRHLSYELIFVERGPYACQLNGVELALPDDVVLVIAPDDVHADHLRPGVVYHALRLELDEPLPGARPAPVLAPGASMDLRAARIGEAPIWSLLRRIEQANVSDNPLAIHLREALAAEVFWTALGLLPQSALAPALLEVSRRDQRTSRLRELFQRNLRRTLTLAAMARAVGLSPRGLHQHCRQAFGLSPARTHLRYRLEHARRLLRETDVTVKEVSATLGFTDPFHFSRVYRRHFGHPPSADRRAMDER